MLFNSKQPLALAAAAAVLLWLPFVNAHGSDLLGGYGGESGEPFCGWACRYAMPTSLDCPEFKDMTQEERDKAYPTGTCFGQDTSYLTSIALCISQRCKERHMSEMDKFWEDDLYYNPDEVVPKWTYLEALAYLNGTTDFEPFNATSETVFNRTITVDDFSYLSEYNGALSYSKVEHWANFYMLLIFLSGICIPAGLSLLSALPWPAKWVSTFNGYLIDPPAFGKKHSVPVLGLAMIPTRGQAIYILYTIVINIVANYHGYPRYTPNSFFTDRTAELTRHIANRAGYLSLANMPLVFLYGGRNSMLLWISNWSHASYLLAHRWIAIICVIQACLHSAMWLKIEMDYDAAIEAMQQPYWYYGIVATLAFSFLLPASILPFRKRWYEIFLITHILLSIAALVGIWYHIRLIYGGAAGYDIFVYTSIGVWFFDRLMRWLRVGHRGIKRAYVSRVDDEYNRVDIPGVDCHGYCYAYFPTLSWRIWENHPFSVVGYNGTHAPRHPATPISHSDSDETGTSAAGGPQLATSEKGKEHKFSTKTRSIATRNGESGITLFIRPHSGLTRLLAAKCGDPAGVPILVEGTYGHEGKTLLQGAESKFAPTPDYPNIICLAGGVGITAILPALNMTFSLYGPMGTTKLFWGIRNRNLVDSIEGMLAIGDETNPWGHIEPHITVGSRINVRQVLEKEIGESNAGTTVIVCGPLVMCDEARYTVAAMARHGKTLKFVEESLPW